jgi:hypothetical protein
MTPVLTHAEAKQLRDSTCMNDPLALIHATEMAVLKKQAAIAAAEKAAPEGVTTGWPPGLLQDDCRALAQWMSSRPDAMYRLRQVYAEDETLSVSLGLEPDNWNEKAEPLTDEQIDAIWQDSDQPRNKTPFAFARAIEAEVRK